MTPKFKSGDRQVGNISIQAELENYSLDIISGKISPEMSFAEYVRRYLGWELV